MPSNKKDITEELNLQGISEFDLFKKAKQRNISSASPSLDVALTKIELLVKLNMNS